MPHMRPSSFRSNAAAPGVKTQELSRLRTLYPEARSAPEKYACETVKESGLYEYSGKASGQAATLSVSGYESEVELPVPVEPEVPEASPDPLVPEARPEPEVPDASPDPP